MESEPTWTIREAGADDAAALALIGAATFLETFAGVIDGEAIVGHCAAQHRAEAYRALLADGAQLMARAVAAAAGHRRLLLGVYAQNHRALAFYRKQGFADIGTRRFDVGGHSYDDFVLARPLAA